jgi:hypothetical protein
LLHHPFAYFVENTNSPLLLVQPENFQKIKTLIIFSGQGIHDKDGRRHPVSTRGGYPNPTIAFYEMSLHPSTGYPE